MANDAINLLKEIGYPFLFIWSILEGEIGLMLAGWLSSNNIFEFKKVLLIAISGAMIGDIIVFSIGKLYSKQAKEWLNKNTNKEKLEMLVQKYSIFLIIFERFIYGTHIPLLLIFGISGYNFKKWLLLDFIGIMLWAIGFVSIGYFFGQDVIESVMFFQKELLILFLIVIVIVIIKK